MEQIPDWQVKILSTGQELSPPPPTLNGKSVIIVYFTRDIIHFYLCLSSWIHIISSYIFDFGFNIILPSASMSSKWFLSIISSHQNLERTRTVLYNRTHSYTKNKLLFTCWSTLCEFLFSPSLATSPDQNIFLVPTAPAISDEEYESWSSSFAASSSVPLLPLSLKAKDFASQPHKATDKTSMLYVSIFMVLHSE